MKGRESSKYDSRVSVEFQRKAWADRKFCLHWVTTIFKKHMTNCDVEGPKLLICDNLDGQQTAAFKSALTKQPKPGPKISTARTSILIPTQAEC